MKRKPNEELEITNQKLQEIREIKQEKEENPQYFRTKIGFIFNLRRDNYKDSKLCLFLV